MDNIRYGIRDARMCRANYLAPFQGAEHFGDFTGGIASTLNPRLPSENPPGSKT